PRDLVLEGASGQQRDFNLGPQRGLADRDRVLADQVAAVAVVESVLAYLEDDTQIAARAARIARLALAGNARVIAGIHAGRDRNFQRALDGLPASALTGRTRIDDHGPPATAGPARLLDAEEALAHQHRALAVAPLAHGRLRSAPSAVTGAFGANLFAGKTQR